MVQSCDLSWENHHSEDLGCVDEWLVEGVIADRRDSSDDLENADVTMVETQYLKNKSPERSHRLQFSDNKRNLITESLFAGNIYVGGRYDDDEEVLDDGVNDETTREEFSSWREKFKRKLSS